MINNKLFRENNRYKVILNNNNHYINDLPLGKEKDTLIIYNFSEGGYTTKMETPKMMQESLQDIYQYHELLFQGDVFETEFGNYICKGLKVIPLF